MCLKKMEDIFRNFCLVLTREPDGNNALVPWDDFKDAYEFVTTNIEPVENETRTRFVEYMTELAYVCLF